jgi:hypothetical protein
MRGILCAKIVHSWEILAIHLFIVLLYINKNCYDISYILNWHIDCKSIIGFIIVNRGE